MNDPYNATVTELQAWAYQSSDDDPVEQDWEIIATRADTAALFLKLASDAACPKQLFSLSCLYLFAGDAHRTDYRAYSRSQVAELLAQVPSDAPPHILRWAQRTRELLSGKHPFNYEAWCRGVLARAEGPRSAG